MRDQQVHIRTLLDEAHKYIQEGRYDKADLYLRLAEQENKLFENMLNRQKQES